MNTALSCVLIAMGIGLIPALVLLLLAVVLGALNLGTCSMSCADHLLTTLAAWMLDLICLLTKLEFHTASCAPVWMLLIVFMLSPEIVPVTLICYAVHAASMN